VANQGPLYIQEEAQPCAISRNNREDGTIEKGNNKTGHNNGLIIARNNGEGENNSEPIRGELKYEIISLDNYLARLLPP
jgi:hypothetical protein